MNNLLNLQVPADEPRLTKLSKYLNLDSDSIKTHEDVFEKINELYSLLRFQPWPFQISSDEKYIDLTDLILGNLFFQQFTAEKTLIEIIRALNTQGSVDRSFRHVYSNREIDIDEKSIINIAIAIRMHQKKSGYSPSDKEILVCQKNVETLLRDCLRFPYLHCLTPLYIFLRYRTMNKDFFISSIPAIEKENFFYSYLKEEKKIFQPRTKEKRFLAENDKQLMGMLLSETGSAIGDLRFSYDYGKNNFDKKLYRWQRRTNSFSFEDQEQSKDKSLPMEGLIACVPAPNWRCFFGFLLERGTIKQEDVMAYMDIIHRSNRRITKVPECLNPYLCDIIFKMLEIARPQNFFSFHLKIDQTVRMIIALKAVYKYLIDGCAANEDEMFQELMEEQFFEYININELAFWRFTRYTPTECLGFENQTCRVINEGFYQLMREEREYVHNCLYLQDLDLILPSNAEFKELTTICYDIYLNWKDLHTNKFCEKLLPILSIRSKNFDKLLELARHGITQKDYESVEKNFSSEVSEDYNCLGLDGLDDFEDFLNEVLRDSQKNAIKKDKKQKILQKLLDPSSVTHRYNLHILVDLCFDLVTNDLHSQFWECHYALADKIYPIRLTS